MGRMRGRKGSPFFLSSECEGRFSVTKESFFFFFFFSFSNLLVGDTHFFFLPDGQSGYTSAPPLGHSQPRFSPEFYRGASSV